jgi:hypothetical protein
MIYLWAHTVKQRQKQFQWKKNQHSQAYLCGCGNLVMWDARTEIVPLRPGLFLGVAAHW